MHLTNEIVLFDLDGTVIDSLRSITVQIFWFAAMTLVGRILFKKALKKVVVQGG